jgi:hypothetical protein
MKNVVEAAYMGRVAGLGCLICRRLGYGYAPAELHHVAEGSGHRSNFAVAPLCSVHHDEHRRGTGFHGMGTERFCAQFRVPGESEYGLLVWVNEDLQRSHMGVLVMGAA